MNLQECQEKRFVQRFASDRDATLRDADARPRDVIVGDISRSGFRVTGIPSLTVGADITIGLPGLGRRAASVVRAEAGEIGCMFVTELKESEVKQALVATPLTPIFLPIELLSCEDETTYHVSHSSFSRTIIILIATTIVLPWTLIVLLMR